MGKLRNKYLLASLVALVALGSLSLVAHAAKTKFTNVEVTGTLDVDGAMTTGVCSCSNISTTSLTANNITATTSVTASSAVLTSATIPLKFTGSVDPTSTPSAAGILGQSSSHILYISTGTGAAAWQKVSTQ